MGGPTSPDLRTLEVSAKSCRATRPRYPSRTWRAGRRDFAGTARNEQVELDPTWPFVGTGRCDHDGNEHEDDQLEDNEHDPHPPNWTRIVRPSEPEDNGPLEPPGPGRRNVSISACGTMTSGEVWLSRAVTPRLSVFTVADEGSF